MTQNEYRAAREALGWTQLEMAEYLGVGERTPYRYSKGDIPEPVARLVRLLVTLRLTVNQRKFDELVGKLQ